MNRTNAPAQWRRDVGLRIRHQRMNADLTQRELARRSGLSQPALSNYENGKRALPVLALIALSQELRVAPQHLIGEHTRSGRWAG